MSRWLFIYAACSMLVAFAAASPSGTLSQRDDSQGLTCNKLDHCESWYLTSSATCASGYKRTATQTAHKGSYCERSCTDEERKECAAEQCKAYTSQCDQGPASLSCKDALNWCNTPIKMDKSICTGKDMGEPVKYDEASGTCAKDHSSEAAIPKHLVMHMSRVGKQLFMSCNPVTIEGAKDIVKKIKSENNVHGCQPINYDDPAPSLTCNGIAEGRWDGIDKTAKAACKAADHPGSEEPVFESRRF